MRYKWIGTHAQDLADGRMLGIGEEVELDRDQIKEPHNKALLDDGTLIEVKTQQAEKEGGSK